MKSSHNQEIIINYLIADINSRYDLAVAQSVTDRNGGNLAAMGSIEYEQALDDLLTIVNECD